MTNSSWHGSQEHTRQMEKETDRRQRWKDRQKEKKNSVGGDREWNVCNKSREKKEKKGTETERVKLRINLIGLFLDYA